MSVLRLPVRILLVAIAAFLGVCVAEGSAAAPEQEVVAVIKRMFEGMKRHTAATITLTGCSVEAGGNEKGSKALSLRRAEAVRDYLTSVWGVEPKRIEIRARALPEKPSAPLSGADQIEENRRVEITSDTWAILEPVLTLDTVRKADPVMRFKPVVRALWGARSWKLLLEQDDATLCEFSGAGAPPEAIDWNLAERFAAAPRSESPLRFTLYATDSAGTVAFASDSARVRQVTVQKKRMERRLDRESEQFTLILFDFDKADVEGANKRIVEFIKPRITPASTVLISGHADRTGAADYNRALSERRAQETSKALDKPQAYRRGVGKDVLPHDNSVPEGRFYCRTVEIVIENPTR